MPAWISLPGPEPTQRRDWDTLKSLLPYLWAWKWRVIFALACLVTAKLANVAVPLVFKDIIDGFTLPERPALLVVPLGLLAVYGVLRFSSALFTELREIIFAKVTQRAQRTIALQVFDHLHALSLRFHLERQTGGLTRDIERGTRAVGSLISYTIYSILPTLIEITLVLTILVSRYDSSFAVITFSTLTVYVAFTILVTNWRTKIRREANEHDSAANVRAIDSLINYETVKYFNNEGFEARRYDEQLQKWEVAQIRTQVSLSYLNLGQSSIIAVGVTLMMWRAAIGVSNGSMTVGDIVLVNAFLIQLYMPLNHLGILYREIRQSLTDIERLFGLLAQHREVQDAPDARALEQGPCTVSFDGVPIADLDPLALRRHIALVPQDTVIFAASIADNIRFGKPEATMEQVEAAARSVGAHVFIGQLEDGYDTQVGERGGVLSSGQRQLIAFARALLADPRMLVLDEATSSIDVHSELQLTEALYKLVEGRTAFIVAHRLSTIRGADRIFVVDAGRIVEQGSHDELLAAGGFYADLYGSWRGSALSIEQICDEASETAPVSN